MNGTTRKILLTGALLCSVSADALAAPPDIFVETIASESDVVANCVKTTQDGGFVVTGYTGVGSAGKYLFLAKFGPQGNQLWNKVYAKADSEGRGVVETHEGDFVVVGFTESDGTGTDWLLLKFNSSGSCLWVRTWAESGSEEAHGVIEASDHTLWVVGFTTSFTPGRKEVVLAELGPSGDSLNCARAGKIGWDFSGAAVAEVFGEYGGFCVTGTAFDDNLVYDERYVLLAKFSRSPKFWWADRIGTGTLYERGTSIVRTSDAGLALAGWADDDFYGKAGFLIKLDPDAELDWSRIVAGAWSYPRTVRSVTETEDGGLVVVGSYTDSWLDKRLLLAKWGLGGELRWTSAFGGSSFWAPVGYSVVEDADRSLLVAGSTHGSGTAGDALLARCCCTGQTCLDPIAEEPSFSSWSPDQNRFLIVSDEEFSASLSPLAKWFKPPPEVTPVCSTTIHTVCPDGSADFELIQDAIDYASNGDIIELCDDTFTGVGNRDLDFRGKCITVRSQNGDPSACIIDCANAGRGFYFHSDEGCHSVVEGVTIRNGTGASGGGIYCQGASPTITNCKLQDCGADAGSGIYSQDGSPTITECDIEDSGWDSSGIWASGGHPTISGCRIDGWGAAVESYSASLNIETCTIVNNDDGIRLHGSDAKIRQCTIADNDGYGVSLMYASATVENTILWGNGYPIVLYATEPPSSSIDVTCSDVEGGWPGENNIDEDPRFCDHGAGDYRIRCSSPCAPAQQPLCGLIGAEGVGCCLVCPDASGDVPTIQEAIDAVNDGAIVELCDATFTGDGNRDITFRGKAITVRSQYGPEDCKVDCSGSRSSPHRGFYFHEGEGPDSVLEGVTIVNGDEFMSGSRGGAILCVEASPTITDCRISGNSAFYGGGIYCEDCTPTIARCLITGNLAWGSDGGGIYCTGLWPEIVSCTISGNRAANRGGGIFGRCVPQHTIIWGNCAGSQESNEWYGDWGPTIYNCCDDLGPGLDAFDEIWHDCELGPNISADPLFYKPVSCEDAPTSAGDYHLLPDSPCAPAQQPVCELIGVLDVGGLPVTHLPELGVPAQFEVNPQDDLGQGGYTDPPTFVETPAHLFYDPPVGIKFRNGTMPLYPERELQGWWMGLAPPEIFAPDYTWPSLVSDTLSKVVLLFNTVLDVSASSVDKGVENVYIEITERESGDPMYDIDGLGDGTTPFTRKYVPMNDYSYDYEYYQWICFQAPETLPDGTPFLHYYLTYVDGTTTEFENPDFPGRVCLRITDFAAAEVVYGEAAPCERADVNCDGAINGFDIDPFVLALVDEAGYYATYPDCDHMCADIDCDGAVTGFDIDGFVVCVTAGVCDPCP